jgi:peptidoglycan/LPS O-acetylase OafA/YrhL
MSNHAKRIDAVDGLRAIAVLPVILFHLNPSWLPGGYLGVDIFFVISGYLITGIIAREITENTFTFTGFYRRRIRRILPALVAMMTAVLATCIFLNPIQLNEVARQIQAVIVLNGNGALCDGVGNYWGANALADPLLHTWSLGVEEQFYLLFPLLIWLLVRYQGVARTLIWVLGFGLISFAWFLIQSAANPPKAFIFSCLGLGSSWPAQLSPSLLYPKLEATSHDGSQCSPAGSEWQ